MAHLPPSKYNDLPPPDNHNPFYESGNNQSGQGDAFDVNKFLTFLLRFWWVSALAVILAVTVAVLYIVFKPPTYVSSAQMWEPEKMGLPDETSTGDSQDYISTQIQLLKSDKIRDLTLQYLRDQGAPIPLAKESRLGVLLKHLTGQDSASPDHGHPLPVQLKIDQASKTTVIDLLAFSKSQAYCQTYLKAFMTVFLEYKQSVRKTQSGDTFASISQQAISLGQQLKADQDALTDFERTNNLAVLQTEASEAGTYLTSLQTRLSGLELESQFLNATALVPDWTGQGKSMTGGFPGGSQSGGSSLPGSASATPSPLTSDLQTAWAELQALKIQRQTLSRNLRPEHPKIVRLDREIAQGQQLIDSYRTQSKEELAASQQALAMNAESIKASIKEWNAKVVEANSRIAEAERLKLDIARTETLYDQLVTLLQNVDISREVNRESLAIFQPASPASRSFRKDFILLSLAMFGGLCSGVAIIVLLQVRDDRFSTIAEVDEKFGGIIVGQVPEMRLAGGNDSVPLLESENQRGIYAESYRSLRSALLFLPADAKRVQIILITSALPGEGKSTITANLAKALAFGGSRVLLVDGDLRKGQLHKALGHSHQPGLAELIRNPDEAGKIIQIGSQPNLAFIARGNSQGHPGDLFLKPELDRLFARWREQFDYVLIDSCPVFAADDVSMLANKVDGTLFVLRRRFSRNAVVREALELLLQRQANILGLVFNRANASGRSYHNYRYADYHDPAGEKS